LGGGRSLVRWVAAVVTGWRCEVVPRGWAGGCGVGCEVVSGGGVGHGVGLRGGVPVVVVVPGWGCEVVFPGWW
jgi:hypothetical protein